MEIMLWILTLFTSVWVAFFMVAYATTMKKLNKEAQSLREEAQSLRKEREELKQELASKRAELAELAREVHFAEMAFYEQGQLLDETKEKLQTLENWNYRCLARGERFRKEARELLANAEKKLTSFQQLVGKWHGHTPVPQQETHVARVQTLVACASISPQLRRMLGM